MSLKNVILIIAALIITSCNFLKHGNSFTPTDDDKIVFRAKTSNLDSNQVTYVECEEFIANALNNYSIEKMPKAFPFLKCTSEPVINMHDSSFIDTVYTFSNSKNKIQFYRARHKDFIITFDIKNSECNLNGNLRTGITKERFKQKFLMTESISNEVRVINSDSSMKFIFYFENNRIERIKSDLYFD